MRRSRRIALAVGVVAAVGLLPVAVVQAVGQTHVRGSTASAGPADVALVLGAGLRPDGSPSTYLRRRLDAAAELYAAGTVRAVVVSGDGVTQEGYDEPAAMTAWLVDRGVPAEHVVADEAGVDTHDSCVRAVQVLGVERAVVVTQDYHLRRALFSCDAAGLEVTGVGVSAESVQPTQAVLWRLREAPASLRAAWDAVVAREPVHRDDRRPDLADALAIPPVEPPDGYE